MRRMKNLVIGLCVLGGMHISGASAEVVQDCILSGEVVSSNQQSSEKVRVRFHKMEHGELANCNLKGRAKRGRVDADITMTGLDLPKGSKVTYAFQQTRSEANWQLLSVQRPVLLTSKD